jgi:hypothetical protein
VSAQSQKHISAFMNFVNSNIAREANLLLERSGHLWHRRYASAAVVGGERIEVARLKYLLAQGTKEGLVDSPLRWPGVQAAGALANGENLRGIWVNRTDLFKACRKLGPDKVQPIKFEQQLTPKLDPLPCWSHLSATDYQRRIRELIQDIEAEAAARHRNQGTQPLGHRAVRHQHPHHRPERLKKSPAPLVHAPTKKLRQAFLAAYRLFVQAFRTAAEKLRSGDLTAKFPEGSFPPGLPFVEEVWRLKPG